MKTLIITVGTRQLGWRCNDGIVRSLGADGGKFDPAHIDELYRDELGLERGQHYDEGSDRPYPWSMWDLGQRLYQHCQQTKFNSVELLLDQVIIDRYLPQGLSHVILWGTQQPESVSWNYRRMDTAWLAELMAGKLQELNLGLTVKVFRPTVGAVDADATRDVLEGEILPVAMGTRQPKDDDFTLLIENKGATPAMSEGLSICAAALVRDCQVVTVSPIEARPLYPHVSDTVQAVATAQECRSVNLSSYFWPLERSRILSAWQRGDFREAQVWLYAHRPRHKPLYDLAEYLALTTNWQMDEALKAIKNWVGAKGVKTRTLAEQRDTWQTLVTNMCPAGGRQTPDSKYLKIWETRFLIDLELRRENYTAAFVQFAQTLERLLFWRYETEDWIQQGLVTPPPDKQAYGLKYKASLADLKKGWLQQNEITPDHPTWIQLDAINELRNSVIHRSTALTPSELRRQIWPELTTLTHDTLYAAMLEILQKLLPPHRPMPDRSLLQDLYHWGIEQLQP
jgi:hypothetical protein